MIQSALQYLNEGYSVIPVDKEKRSLIKWEPYQKERPTEALVREWFTKFKNPNIAIITGEQSNLMVVDTDTPEAMQEVQNYLPDTIITPIQTTPHGGKHFFFQYIDGFTNRARVAPGIDIRTQGGYIVVDPSVNGNGKHWQWLEGLSLHDITPAPMPSALLMYIKEFAFGFYKGVTKSKNESLQFLTFGSRDDDLFHTANCLSKGSMEEYKIRKVIEILALNCDPPFSLKEANEKVESAIKRAERKERNLRQELEQWISLTSGLFSLTEAYMQLQILTSKEKNNVHQIMNRLCKDGIIERSHTKNGVYRRIETSADEIDFMNVEDKVIDLRWPFDIERWVKILPKNIIVIAGESNAGKTAFLLNLCFLNMGNFKINYFSSEMGAMELRDRLKKFETNLQGWKENINFRERSSNFADVIKPNDVNIIDFLEITDEFYKVGGMIKEIYDKLKKGIAIIALQKNKGVEMGLGGARSIEKARLYLSIGEGHLKIVKGKNWATEFNPNGMEWKFKLLQGSKFIWRTNELSQT
jgi:hypothetical protein